MVRDHLFLRAARRERTERTPVWLMRQAGRTDPEYRALRERTNLPLEQMFGDSDLAIEASLLPKRLGVDAIVIFQDILTPLTPMGARFVFRPGPRLESPIRSSSDVASLRRFDPASDLESVARTIRGVRKALGGELPVLGFAGAPMTLAYFLIEGRGLGAEPEATRAFMRDDPAGMHRLLEKLADMTADYLVFQIEAGADAVQLFESFAEDLTPDEYRSFAHPYHERIFSRVNGHTPKILFAKEQPDVELMASSGADVLSVGRCVDLADARRRFGHRVAFQGNVDNEVVARGSADEVGEAVRECVRTGEHQGHILNLNHGLLKDTPFPNVRHLIDSARQVTATQEQRLGRTG